jgi:hypothetical protein
VSLPTVELHAKGGPPNESSLVDSLYISLTDAVGQLRDRRANARLCAAVNEFHRPLPPTFLPSRPFGALGRYILTPSLEFDLFLQRSRSAELIPLYFEFKKDIFLARNPDKYRLLRPSFFIRLNCSRVVKLVDFNRGVEMQALASIKTKAGTPLPEFHHSLFKEAYPDLDFPAVDFSDWRKHTPPDEPNYLRFLAIFVCHGILFENYLATDDSELRFVRERVAPAFDEIERRFGVKPLIVRLLPLETEASEYWRQLPGRLFPSALARSRSGS